MTLFLGFVCICAMLRAELPDGIRRLSPFERAVAIIKRFEGWHSARHYPYIGFGHRLREGEKLTADITEAQADSLLRADLAGMCALFRHLGKTHYCSVAWPTRLVCTGCSVMEGCPKVP